MKRILPIVLGLIFSFQISQGQVQNPPNEADKHMYDYYSLKHNKQKRIGGILLGVGAASLITGLVIYSGSEDISGGLSGAGVVAVGVISTIISIPLLISAGKNKKRAEAFIGSQNFGISAMPNFNNRYVAIGLSIGF